MRLRNHIKALCSIHFGKSMPSRPFAQDLRSPNPRKLLQKVVGFLNLLRSYLVQILTFSILSIAFLARKAISSGTVTRG
jgi:hypothetical protein